MPILAYISDNTLSTERPVEILMHAPPPLPIYVVSFFSSFSAFKHTDLMVWGVVFISFRVHVIYFCGVLLHWPLLTSPYWWLGGSMPLDLPDLAAATGTSMDGGLRIN
jgi:hypothetical protein